MRQPLLHAMIFEAVENSPLTLRQIAEAAGIPNANVLSMWRRGDAIPMERVHDLALVLGLDPGLAVLTAFYETQPVIARQLAEQGHLAELPLAGGVSPATEE